MQHKHAGGRRNRWLAPLVKGLAFAGVVGGLGTMGCLSRPVTHREPTTKTNFTTVIRQSAVDKVDLLFDIDNSRSMGDKQDLLARAVPDLVSRLLNPNCIDPNTGEVLGISEAGDCAAQFGTAAKPEFPAVHDMHVGIVSSSLGGRGSNNCAADAMNPTDPSLSAHNDDRGHLINRSDNGNGGETPNQDALAREQGAVVNPNFLAWFPQEGQPGGDKNKGKDLPPVNPLGEVTRFSQDFAELVKGVHEYGCGYEAQLESWYRFLVQPDPYDTIDYDPPGDPKAWQRMLVDYDDELLQQRHDFLRPDSLVAIVVVTDENDSTVDPMSLNRQGWAFEQRDDFPGSGDAKQAPRATVECATNPMSPDCTTCPYVPQEQKATRCPKGDYYKADDDMPNVRFFKMKQRFGVDPQFPISRYVRGLTERNVPDRDHEHLNGDPGYTGEQNANCTNPLFAGKLPTSANEEICSLPFGPRTSDLVFLAVIGGVPHQLLQEDPLAPDSPQKAKLSDEDWIRILGKDPLNYDFTGADPHMLESIQPRPGLPGPSSADNADKINGREWNTKHNDLQYACTFKLPEERDCGTDPGADIACDCTGASDHPPLCDFEHKRDNIQIRGKAYPSIRELALARAMGDQAVVSSLCPIHEEEASAGDPLYGYRPAVSAIVDRLKTALANQCLPQRLSPDERGEVPCLILEILPTKDMACDPERGLSIPSADILEKFKQQLHDEFIQSGEADAGTTVDPSTLPICEVDQIVVEGGKTCADSQDGGWCYVTGVAAGGCPQAIQFSAKGTPVVGARVSLQCIEQAAVPDAGR
jgi:hypothetical protein